MGSKNYIAVSFTNMNAQILKGLQNSLVNYRLWV